MSVRKAVFFDRDGTLIEDVSYLSSLDQIELLPGIVKLCQLLLDVGYVLVIVTNQSGVARGFFSEEFVKKTHQHLAQLFAKHNVTFLDYYYCPHHPDAGVVERYIKLCACRKPRPGMLHRAAQDHDIDLTQSLMIGDRDIDIQAGKCAGCKT